MDADLLAVDPPAAAGRLLGATLHGHGVRAVVVEVEAYGGVPDGPWPDPASHSYRGPNDRNRVMTGPPGRLYTYRSHGIHVCANVVTGPEGTAAAALLRAARIIDGSDRARVRRGRETCVRRWESRWRTTESTSSIPVVRSGWNCGRRGRWLADPASGSARQPTGAGGSGSTAVRRCRPIGAARGHRKPAAAVDRPTIRKDRPHGDDDP